MMVKALLIQAVLGVLAWTTFTAEAHVCESLFNSMVQAQNAVIQAQNAYKECSEQPCGNPRHCVDIWNLGHTTSGIYTVYYLEGTVETPVSVYCDMETAGGGWLVFQRRQDGSEDFYRNWANYADGFGDLQNEFWLGNNQIHKLTSCGQYRLRFDLGDFEGETRYAEYSAFSVGNPSGKYTLSVSGYVGDAGDSFSVQNGMKFTTKDQDNDLWALKNCATRFTGAWWYNTCHASNLNGQYLGGPHSFPAIGVNWRDWRGHNYSLKFTEMKFKPQ